MERKREGGEWRKSPETLAGPAGRRGGKRDKRSVHAFCVVKNEGAQCKRKTCHLCTLAGPFLGQPVTEYPKKPEQIGTAESNFSPTLLPANKKKKIFQN